MGYRHAAQVKIVSLRVGGPRGGFHRSTAAQNRQQPVLDLRRQLLVQPDQVLCPVGNGGLPDQPVAGYIDGLEGHRKPVALLSERAREQASHS